MKLNIVTSVGKKFKNITQNMKSKLSATKASLLNTKASLLNTKASLWNTKTAVWNTKAAIWQWALGGVAAIALLLVILNFAIDGFIDLVLNAIFDFIFG